MVASPPLPAPEGIARELRHARETAGLTQAVLARSVGRSQTHLSTFERGWGRSDARILDLWAAHLGCRWALVPLEADHG